MIPLKHKGFYLASLLLSVLTATATRAGAVLVVAPEVSAYADTEAVTNVVFHAGDADDRQFNFSLELDASVSNNVSVAIGCDANENGVLERSEMDAVIGWDSGAWFYHDRRAGVETECERDSGHLRLEWQLTLNSRRAAKSLLATDAEGTVFANTLPSTMFDPSWNLMRVTARGLSSPNGVVVTEVSGWGFRVIVR